MIKPKPQNLKTMLKPLRRLLLLSVVSLASAQATAQTTLVENGKPAARITLAVDNENNRRAAQLLQRFVRETSGAQLPIVANVKVGKGTVVIGEPTTEARHDGFLIDSHDGVLRIKSAGGKGAIYGVCTLLEQYVGMNYLAADCYTLTPSANVRIPALYHAETPAFRYRQTQSYGCEDSVYYDWFRLAEPKEIFADNLWVHTFDRLLPAAVYGKRHPEYYSFINGERRPGNHSQWCLTNPEIFEIVAHKVDSIFKANPGKTMMSVSQNDGNDTYCQCPECKKVNEYEGSPSGNFIRFLNKLAKRFPDKQFSTLA